MLGDVNERERGAAESLILRKSSFQIAGCRLRGEKAAEQCGQRIHEPGRGFLAHRGSDSITEGSMLADSVDDFKGLTRFRGAHYLQLIRFDQAALNCIQRHRRPFQHRRQVFLRNGPVRGMDQFPPAANRFLHLGLGLFARNQRIH
jgi:hypothetical protein